MNKSQAKGENVHRLLYFFNKEQKIIHSDKDFYIQNVIKSSKQP